MLMKMFAFCKIKSYIRNCHIKSYQMIPILHIVYLKKKYLVFSHKGLLLINYGLEKKLRKNYQNWYQ